MNHDITNHAVTGAEAQEVKNPSKEEVIIQPAKKMFLNGISEYDKAVVVADERKADLMNPVYNREVGEMKMESGNTLYAWINEDGNGNRSYAVCQKYFDGGISKEVEMEQSDLILLAQPVETIDVELMQDVKKLVKRTQKAYLNKFRGMPTEVLHVRNIAKAVMANMASLPTYSDDLTELERAKLYQKIVSIVKTLASQVLDNHEKYYSISDEDLDHVARELGMDTLVLLRKLKKYNLLFLQESAKGYQNMVRLNGTGEGSFLARRYCIIKDAELDKDEEFSGDCDF